jgi:hypothetical protein
MVIAEYLIIAEVPSLLQDPEIDTQPSNVDGVHNHMLFAKAVLYIITARSAAIAGTPPIPSKLRHQPQQPTTDPENHVQGC